MVLNIFSAVLGCCNSSDGIEEQSEDSRHRVAKDEYMIQNGALLLERQISSGLYGRGTNIEPLRIFSFKEIRQAINNFDHRLIVEAKIATIYKGTLEDGRMVAVKSPQGLPPVKKFINFFLNQVTIKQLIIHKNVVKIHGCCLETKVPFVVYEFVPNGSLLDHIRHGAFDIPWFDLVRISAEISYAVSYMHIALSKPIVHMALKPANILLDESFTAKLSNFGLAVAISREEDFISEHVLGLQGYIDPEHEETRRITEKCDVFSFGVILVELLTGKNPRKRQNTDESLVNYFVSCWKRNNILEIAHPRVLSEAAEEEIDAFAALAVRCVGFKGEERPTMRDVSIELRRIQHLARNRN